MIGMVQYSVVTVLSQHCHCCDASCCTWYCHCLWQTYDNSLVTTMCL